MSLFAFIRKWENPEIHMRMRNLFFWLFALSCLGAMAQIATPSTFTLGEIGCFQTTAASLTTTSFESPCNDTLVVNIPPGNVVTSINISYSMTALGVAWMSEQWSYIECVSTGLRENTFARGAGNSAGTFLYNRNNTVIANGPSVTGQLKFVMHAFKTFGNPGCTTTQNRVDNNTWTITVNHIPPPTCPFPSNFNVVSALSTGANLSWTSGGATNWNIQYGPPGFALGSGTIVNASSNPFGLTGLNPNTNYSVYVRDSCAPGDVSLWVGPISFRTLCTAFPAPYTENFSGTSWVTGTGFLNSNDQIDPCWSRNPGSNTGFANFQFFWGTWQGNSNSTTTGPSADHTTGNSTGKYIITESASGTVGNVAEIFSPAIDLSNLNVPELRFWYHMYGTTMGTLTVAVDSGSGWNTLFTISGQQQTSKTEAWREAVAPLAAYANATVRLRFTHNRLGTSGDLAIDDVSILEAPACPQPSNLAVVNATSNSVQLSWNAATATAWEVQYGSPGFILGSGTTVAAGSNPFTITGLTPNTPYQFYVRENCGVAGSSVWIGPINSRTLCVPFAVPFFENFDGSDWVSGTGALNSNDQISPCWSRNPVGNTNSANFNFFWGTFQGATGSFQTGPSADHTTGLTAGKYIYTESIIAGGSTLAEIYSPLIDLGSLSSPELRFWYHMYGSNMGNLRVEVNNGGAWTQIFSITGQQQTAKTSPWLEVVVPLSVYAGDTIQLRFLHNRVGANADLAIDDVSVIQAPTCPQPSNFSLSAITSNSVNLSWTSGGASAWQIEYGPSGFSPGTGTIVNAITNPFVLSGLNPTTNYQVYVRDSCGSGDVSLWVGALTFRTLCSVYPAPYFDNFSSLSAGLVGTQPPLNLTNCWDLGSSAPGNNNLRWETEIATGVNVNTVNTGPWFDNTSPSSAGGIYVFLESSFGTTGSRAIFASPLINISSLTSPELSFYYHMYGATTDSLRVDVFSNGSWDFNVWSLFGQQQSSGNAQWIQATVPLSAYSGDIRVRFVGRKGTGFNGDIALDDIRVDEAITCFTPTLLNVTGNSSNSISLGWTSGGAANWQIEYGASGFALGSGTLVNASSNPFTINGLNPNTAYDFYVRDSCSAGSVSFWSSALTARTLCTPFAAPFTENFDGSTWVSGSGALNSNDQIDACWSRIPSGNSSFANFNFFFGTWQGLGNSTTTGVAFDHTTGNSTGKYIYTESITGTVGSIAEIYSPQIDLSPLNVPELHFWYHMYGSNIGTLEVEVNDGSGWTSVFNLSGQQQNARSAPWREAVVLLSAYANDTIQLRFKHNRLGANGDLSIDDVSLIEAPACPQPSNLIALSIGSNDVNLDWTANAATSWNVQYGAPGFTLGSGTVVAANSKPFLLTGLSPNTTYDIYIQENCGANGNSVWIGPLTITTACLPVLAPYTENFDGSSWVSGTGFSNANDQIDNCWNRNPAGNTGFADFDFFWGTYAGASNSTTTGPSADHTSGANTGKYIYTETVLVGNTTIATITSPAIDVRPLNVPELRFWYHMYGATIGTLTVEVNQGGGWNQVFSISGQQQTAKTSPWQQAIVPLTAYADTTFQVRFSHNRLGNTGDLAIDDFSIIEAPACPQASNFNVVSIGFNSVNLSWTASTASSWNIQYGPPGFVIGSGTTVIANSNPFNVTGLNPNTPYEFYIQEDCGVSGTSAWVGPISARTQCVAFTAPYLETFDGSTWIGGTGALNSNDQIDNCWSRNPLGNTSLANFNFFWGTRQGGGPSTTTGPSTDHTSGTSSGKFVYTEGITGNLGSIAEIFSPLIDLSALTIPELRFWYHMYGSNMGTLEVAVDSGNGFNTIFTLSGQQQTSKAAPWQRGTVNMAAFTNASVQLRFRHNRLGANSDLALDDVSIIEAPPCPDPTQFVVSGQTDVSVSFTYTTAQSGNWRIEYGPSGFTLGSGTVVTGSGSPLTITGLTAGTTYDFYLQDSCNGGGYTAFVGPLTATTASCPTGCFYTLRLTDTFGDGWEGSPGQFHQAGISLNGGAVINYTLPSGNLTTYSISVCQGDILQLGFQNNGAWSNECGIELRDANNTIVFSRPATPGTFPTSILYTDTVDCGFPPPPTCADPSALSASNIGQNSASLSWTSAAGTSRLQYGPAGFALGSGTLIPLVTSLPYNLMGLNAGTAYEFYVQDSCAAGNVSAWVGPFAFTTTTPPACTAPSALSVSNIGQNSASLSWTSPAGTSRLQFGPAGFALGSGTLVPLVTSLPFNLSGLNVGTAYEFYVQDSCAAGNVSAWVGPFAFTTSPCPQPVASFTFTISNLTINVDASVSTGGFYSWNFAGQGTAFNPTASFSFGAEGIYTITLINSNACGNADTISQTVAICNPLSVSITNNTLLLSSAFSAVVNSGVPNSFQWDFGDGFTGNGQFTNHTYASAGIYNVQLIATNACNERDTSMITLQVCDSISAGITYTSVGTNFSFNSSGSYGSSSYLWLFGDGNSDTNSNPSHTYSASGNYVVSLVVGNDCGDLDTAFINVTVCQKPEARWTFNVVQTSPLGMTVQFDASQSTGAVNYFWSFGDGATNSTSGFPLHTYGTPGFFYVVSLIVYNSCGDSDTLTSTLAGIGLEDASNIVVLKPTVYPNPASSEVFLSWNLPKSGETVEVDLLDVSGKHMKGWKFEVGTEGLGEWLQIDYLADGVYFIGVKLREQNHIVRFIKE